MKLHPHLKMRLPLLYCLFLALCCLGCRSSTIVNPSPGKLYPGKPFNGGELEIVGTPKDAKRVSMPVRTMETPVFSEQEIRSKSWTDAKSHKAFLGSPTAEEMEKDKEILRHIEGTWTTAEDPRWAMYNVLMIRPDGSFTTINTNGTMFGCEGTWFVERECLLLVKSNAAPFDYYGFHRIHQLDDHQLVCSPGLSVAGRLRFTK